MPFTYIHRGTALHAAFKSEKLLAIPTNAGGKYKSEINEAPWRRHIDAAETLRQWEERFARGERFRSASEICEMYLVPEGEKLEAMPQFWTQHALTGDNVRERPYANLQAMLTTQSDSYTVYMKGQRIQKAPNSPPDIFDPALDRVIESWSGKGSLQRFLAMDDPRIEDTARNTLRGLPTRPLSGFYQTTLGLSDPGAPFAISAIEIDTKEGLISITWNSKPGQFYGVESSRDFKEWSRLDTNTETRRSLNYLGIPSQGYRTQATLSIRANIAGVRVVRL